MVDYTKKIFQKYISQCRTALRTLL